MGAFRRRFAVPLLALATLIHPAAAQKPWKLVEDLRIGGGASGPTSFDLVADLAVDAQGKIFVYDYKAQEIRLFDAAGKFVRLVGRSGAGPGEYQQPNGMRLAPDGKLWVHDYKNSRLVVFRNDGTFDRQMIVTVTSFGSLWDGSFDLQGRLRENVYVPSPTPGVRGTNVLQRFNPSTGRADTLPIPKCDILTLPVPPRSWSYTIATGGGTVGIPLSTSPVSEYDRQGGFWCGDGIDYHLKGSAIEGGATITEISRKLPALPFPPGMRDSVIADMWKKLPARAPRDQIDVSQIPSNFPRFERLSFDEKGSLWAFRPTVTHGSQIDVWSRTGQQLATVTAPRNVTIWVPMAIRDDHLYLVMEDDDGVHSVVRYRIVTN